MSKQKTIKLKKHYKTSEFEGDIYEIEYLNETFITHFYYYPKSKKNLTPKIEIGVGPALAIYRKSEQGTIRETPKDQSILDNEIKIMFGPNKETIVRRFKSPGAKQMLEQILG